MGGSTGERSKVFSDSDTTVAFRLYMLYLVSFFLHLPSRVSLLGVIRFDFVLVGLITFFILSSKTTKGSRIDKASGYLLAILVYAVITLPIVEWPGSVINNGIVLFIKGAIFYFFTVNLVTSEARLKKIVFVFVACNLIRVLEPLILHMVTGYWGARTYLGEGDFATRLSGAPSDVINPNGLAFVIATITPFLHYVFSAINKKTFSIYIFLIPVLLYAMLLTLSRSGMLALGIISFGIWVKSKHKVSLLTVGLFGIIIIFINLNDVERDRYLSIVSEDARQSASADGRIEAWWNDFGVAMHRPIIGHGLGTSREANWNVAGKDQISHILWAEIWQEIGLIGLFLFVMYMISIIKNFKAAGRMVASLREDIFLNRVVQAMQVWLLMNLLFSLASYGLKSYEWYFFGGLSVVVYKLAEKRKSQMYSNENDEKIVGNGVASRYPLMQKLNEYRKS